jgi:hypothetical protein
MKGLENQLRFLIGTMLKRRFFIGMGDDLLPGFSLSSGKYRRTVLNFRTFNSIHDM